MIENNIQSIVTRLLKSINESIPINYDELHINVEMSQDGGTVYFFFRPIDDNKFYYSLMVPEEFNIPNKEFRELYNKQFNISRELWNIFKENGLAEWTSVAISYVRGQTNIAFDYTPWINSSFGSTDRLYYFMFQHIGYSPKNFEEEKKFILMKEYQEQLND